MNYEFMEYLDNGVIIEKIDTNEIIFINSKARELFNIAKSRKNLTFKDLFLEDNSFEPLHNKITTELNNTGLSIETIYIKSNDIFIETTFKCTWINEETKLACFVFENPVEVTNEKNLKFQEVAEFLPSGVIVMDVDDDLSVTYANAEHYKILGIDESKQEINTILKDTIYEEDKDWVMEEVYNNLHKGKDVDIEFRMKVQHNKLKWVRLYGRAKKSSSGNMLFYSSLKDLSNRREINDKLHLERILFHKITEMSDEILFRLDLKTEIIHFLGTMFTTIFDSEPVMENFPQCIFDSNVLYEDDLPIFKSMLKAFEVGERKFIEFRLRMPDSNVEWHQVLYNFVKSSDGEPLLVVGKLINIQKQKLLEEQAKTDLLTGFYNKINTAMEINKILSDSSIDDEHSMMIIDIDNFKSINDNLGHHFGDIVLHDIANDIRSCFRKNDVLGRIGGDEFIVFMRDCFDISTIEEKANAVCNALEKTFKGKEKTYSISASIGVSRCPSDGISYETLYQMADIALYKTKERGKNNYTIYTTELNSRNRLVPSTIHSLRRSHETFINFNVIATVFNLLYETKDISLTLNTIIEYIATTFNADRCYIYQTLDCGKIYKNDYQWDKDIGFIAEERVQYVNEKALMDILEEADEDGVYYTNDIYNVSNKVVLNILEKEKVKAFYIIESLKPNERRAFFGIDDCRYNRDWTEQERRTLFHIGRMIFIALTTHNSLNYLRNKVADLEIQ